MHNRVFVLILLMALTACSAFPVRESRTESPASMPLAVMSALDNSAMAWHAVRVRFPRDEDGAAQWHLGALVAHQVFQAIVDEPQLRPPLWRFHRRAGNDATGHQFSFIFFDTDASAAAIFDRVNADPVLLALTQRGEVSKVVTSLQAYNDAARLSATSDPVWSPEVQEYWPFFIMGLSRTWLGLVDANAGDADDVEESIPAMIERYRLANARVSEIWMTEGQHAFFHHTSAIFGYHPIAIQKILRF